MQLISTIKVKRASVVPSQLDTIPAASAESILAIIPEWDKTLAELTLETANDRLREHLWNFHLQFFWCKGQIIDVRI